MGERGRRLGDVVRVGRIVRAAALASWLLCSGAAAMAASACASLGFNVAAQAKPTKLYLYFPASDDWTFPEFHANDEPLTRPARAFDITKLTTYVGSEADLRQEIIDVVTDIYCEFNVEVKPTFTYPVAGLTRGTTVAVGADAGRSMGQAFFGKAENYDVHDAKAIDHGRVFAGSYNESDSLTGADSTVLRWGNSIGGTAAHEAGHNYGLSHLDGDAVGAGEDALEHHLMAEGVNYSYQARTARRHFSDREFEILAGNVGMAIQTMFTWGFQNPNQQSARGVTIGLLSTQPNPTLANVYLGPQSPWGTPDLTCSGTAVLQGVMYFSCRLEWKTAKAWSGGPDGEVPGGAQFQVGVSFTTANPSTGDTVIATGVFLSDGGGRMSLHPRTPGFDAGTFDVRDGSFAVNAYQTDPGMLLLEDTTVRLLPRLVSINALEMNAPRLFGTFDDVPVRPWANKKAFDLTVRLQRTKPLRIPVARLRDTRRAAKVVGPAECARGDAMRPGPDTANCTQGFSVGLFPATSALISATVVEPLVKHWDRERRKYVVGPVRSHVAYQLVGRHPDLDRNGVDDHLDILSGNARDLNGDGVPDHAQPRR